MSIFRNLPADQSVSEMAIDLLPPITQDHRNNAARRVAITRLIDDIAKEIEGNSFQAFIVITHSDTQSLWTRCVPSEMSKFPLYKQAEEAVVSFLDRVKQAPLALNEMTIEDCKSFIQSRWRGLQVQMQELEGIIQQLNNRLDLTQQPNQSVRPTTSEVTASSSMQEADQPTIQPAYQPTVRPVQSTPPCSNSFNMATSLLTSASHSLSETTSLFSQSPPVMSSPGTSTTANSTTSNTINQSLSHQLLSLPAHRGFTASNDQSLHHHYHKYSLTNPQIPIINHINQSPFTMYTSLNHSTEQARLNQSTAKTTSPSSSSDKTTEKQKQEKKKTARSTDQTQLNQSTTSRNSSSDKQPKKKEQQKKERDSLSSSSASDSKTLKQRDDGSSSSESESNEHPAKRQKAL